MDDVEVTGCGQFEHTDDVHTDAGELRVGGEFGGEVWVGRVEHLGGLFGEWGVAGVFAGDGGYL